MRIKLSLIFCFFSIYFLNNQAFSFTPNKDPGYKLETSDLGRFWVAFDSLKNANTKKDSINVIDRLYLSRMSRLGKKFIAIRKYTAEEYINTIKRYPKYLAALRLKTDHFTQYQNDITGVFNKLENAIPGYKVPDVCFAIGCFRGGGTTQNKTIFIGAEIALADSTMEYSEFKGWLKTVLSTTDGNIAALIAHESIHCNQYNGHYGTLPSILREGMADFLPALFLNTNINKITYAYGLKHECELWQEFKKDNATNDYSKWLYNSSTDNDRPADLGYFIGRKIIEAYYNSRPDKTEAIKDMLNGNKYLQILQQSDYNGYCNIKVR